MVRHPRTSPRVRGVVRLSAPPPHAPQTNASEATVQVALVALRKRGEVGADRDAGGVESLREEMQLGAPAPARARCPWRTDARRGCAYTHP